MNLPDFRLYRIQSQHQHLVLFTADLLCLLRRPRPGEGSLFQPLVQKQESCPFPEKALDPVTPFAAEEKQHILLERVQVKCCPDDLCQSVNPFPQVRIATGDIDFLYTGRLSKQDPPPL